MVSTSLEILKSNRFHWDEYVGRSYTGLSPLDSASSVQDPSIFAPYLVQQLVMPLRVDPRALPTKNTLVLPCFAMFCSFEKAGTSPSTAACSVEFGVSTSAAQGIASRLNSFQAEPTLVSNMGSSSRKH